MLNLHSFFVFHSVCYTMMQLRRGVVGGLDERHSIRTQTRRKRGRAGDKRWGHASYPTVCTRRL